MGAWGARFSDGFPDANAAQAALNTCGPKSWLRPSRDILQGTDTDCQHAVGWMLAPPPTDPLDQMCSFAGVCETLNLQPEDLIEALIARLDQQQHTRCALLESFLRSHSSAV